MAQIPLTDIGTRGAADLFDVHAERGAALFDTALAAHPWLPLAARLATRIGLVAHPGPLRVHARSVPYLGGVGVFVALIGPVAGARPSMLVPLALACALGVADDATDLAPALRLVVELGIGIAAAWVMAPHDAGHVALGVALVVLLATAWNRRERLRAALPRWARAG